MPETIVRKVDGNGNIREILGNGGSYTVRHTRPDGTVKTEETVGTPEAAIARIQNLPKGDTDELPSD